MIFKAYLRTGAACDYTIGCGQTVITISDVKNSSEAQLKLKEIIKEEYSSYDYRIENCELYEINEVIQINLSKMYSEIENEKLLEEERKENIKEYNEYLRLKEKFKE